MPWYCPLQSALGHLEDMTCFKLANGMLHSIGRAQLLIDHTMVRLHMHNIENSLQTARFSHDLMHAVLTPSQTVNALWQHQEHAVCTLSLSGYTSLLRQVTVRMDVPMPDDAGDA